ncbi:MFS transporter [Anaerovorax odorimutans]|uniref:MFS transporter n=1 Tax=Anaerovorax odorimutans TaxID=109327 RepID=A0ABT1RTT5_9FIRM|nr:MFS transporter [Anaerovorax odorimutans]MCQ4638592.1 MFS transporter [Anaerovorax odorimutans]
MEERHFTRKEKISYGAASLGDTAVYNLLIIYSLYFMTDVVKLNPLIAGNITFIATVWNAFSVGLMGYLSDRHPLKGGKRIPYMRLSILPMAIALVLFFSVTEGSSLYEAGYYTVMLAILMTAHSNFMIPYEALGADLTMNPHERTDLRGYARFFMGMGNLVAVVFLLPIIAVLETKGVSTSGAWQIVICVIAVIAAISQAITCKAFKNETKVEKKEAINQDSQKLFKEYLAVLRLKPFRQLLLITLLICVANVFCNSSIAYFMKYNLGITENSKALVLGIMTVVGIVMTPILSHLSKKYDKKAIMTLCYLITAIAFLTFAIIKISSIVMLCIYIVIFTVGTSAYWQLIYAMLYDISEIDEYENNRRREATILSMSKIILKLSNACAAQLLAIVLFIFGYDQNAAVQSSEALWGIQCSLTIIPGLLFAVAAVGVKRYPVSEEKHMEIVQALKKRKE